MSVCLFDSFSCKSNPGFKNEVNKNEVDKKDTFLVNDRRVTLEDFFSKDFGHFKKEISPKARLDAIKSDPEFKYRKDSKGEYVTFDGKELKLSKELLDHIDTQDRLFYGKDDTKTAARMTPPRAQSNAQFSFEQNGHRQYNKLVHVPSQNSITWLQKAQILFQQRKISQE
jgi:hypothetical protein